MKPFLIAAVAAVVLAGGAMAQTADAPLTTRLDPEEGEYLVAGNGYAVYLFKADRQGTANSEAMSACEGDCLGVWPPLIVDADPVGAGNVDQSLLGTMTRSDGLLQATYNGWPLYFYAEDFAETDINGHDIESFGEDWYLIGPHGERAED